MHSALCFNDVLESLAGPIIRATTSLAVNAVKAALDFHPCSALKTKRCPTLPKVLGQGSAAIVNKLPMDRTSRRSFLLYYLFRSFL
jgi:hypothetical protein